MDEQSLGYCPKCASAFRKGPENSLVCESCGFKYFVNPRPCNAVIIENNTGEILLVKRKIDPKKGMWDLPGGFMAVNETAEESLVREAREELNAHITSCRYIASYPDRYLYEGVNYHTLCFVYVARIEETPLQPKDDVASFQFFAKNKLPFDGIAFEGLKEALKTYVKETTR